MEVKVIGRLIPDSNKIHQNQEVYDYGGGFVRLKAQTIKIRRKLW